MASTSCSTASANRSGSSSQLLAQRVHEHRLERGDVARHVGRRARVAPPRSAASDAARSACSFVSSYGSPSPSAIAFAMSLISSGSSRAICSVGSSRISSSDARSIRRTSHGLGKLVARALEAREGSPDAASLRVDRTLSETADRRRHFREDCARERPDHDRRGPPAGAGGRHPPRGRAGSARARRSAACWPRRCRARSPCRPSTARRWTASRWWRGRRRARRGRRGAGGASVRGRGGAGHGGADLHRGRGARGRRRRGAGGATPRRRVERGASSPHGAGRPMRRPATNVRRAGEDIRPRCRRSASGHATSGPPSWASRRRSGRAELRCARQPARRRRSSPATS